VVSAELQVAFGQVLRDLRRRAGLSQEELSFRCHRDRTYVSLIERGINAPSITTVWLLAGALEVKPSEIMILVEERVPSIDGSRGAARARGRERRGH
jgi:transcriptional regulator with XRE-family HTH domain